MKMLGILMQSYQVSPMDIPKVMCMDEREQIETLNSLLDSLWMLAYSMEYSFPFQWAAYLCQSNDLLGCLPAVDLHT